jgi:hypothetical protein
MTAVSAFAQQDNAGGSEQLVEIVVTAQRREQNLQDTPVAVSAFGAQELRSSGVSSVQELGQVDSSLNIPAAAGVYLPFLRGIGNDAAGSVGNESSVPVFAIISDTTLVSVAEYWAENADRSVADAVKALRLLRNLFERCARPEKTLLDAPSLLERRVGLLKYHANRGAAHISLEPFLFDVIDLVHVVAAVAVLGAMIVDFDDPNRGRQYFNSVDEAGWQSAKSVFPGLPLKRLFHNFDIH